MNLLAGIAFGLAVGAAIGMVKCTLWLRGLDRRLSQLEERLRELEEAETKKTTLL
jgi:hypothetical protein